MHRRLWRALGALIATVLAVLVGPLTPVSATVLSTAATSADAIAIVALGAHSDSVPLVFDDIVAGSVTHAGAADVVVTGACAAVTAGVGSVGCVMAGGFVGGAVYGAMSCPQDAGQADCILANGGVGVASAGLGVGAGKALGKAAAWIGETRVGKTVVQQLDGTPAAGTIRRILGITDDTAPITKKIIPKPNRPTAPTPGASAEKAATNGIRVFRSGGSGVGRGGISLEQAAAAGSRNGIDMRIMELAYEAGGPGYGFTSYTMSGKPFRAANGRFLVTLTDRGLASEADAVNTIAHELNHLREAMRTGRSIVDEGPAIRAGNLAEEFFR